MIPKAGSRLRERSARTEQRRPTCDKTDMAVELPGSEEEAAARKAIAQAAARFARAPQRRAADLCRPAFCAARCRKTWCATPRPISPRSPSATGIFWPSGRPAAEDFLRHAELDASHASVTVIEIANDDMPFLVDSVMGELAEHRLAVRLVAHPVLRREAARAASWSRSARPMPPTASAKASSISTSTRSRMIPRAPIWCAGCKPCSAKCG